MSLSFVPLVAWKASDLRKNCMDARPSWPDVAIDLDGTNRRSIAFGLLLERIGVPVDGRVPLPAAAPLPVDPLQDFRDNVTYLGGWEIPDEPGRSLVRVSLHGQEYALQPGAELAGFQLVQFAVDAEDGLARLLFVARSGTGIEVAIEGRARPASSCVAAVPSHLRCVECGAGAPAVARSAPLTRRAFRDPASGVWTIPADERRWLETWGVPDVLARLATKVVTDTDGRPRGLRILATPELGTPLATSHGIARDDIVRTINGVAIGSLGDVLGYLRGAGRDLSRYVVVLDRGGRRVEVVLEVERLR